MADLARESGGRGRSASRAGTFELKSRRFSLLGLVLHSADMAELAVEWAAKAGQGGFEHDSKRIMQCCHNHETNLSEASR